MPEARGLLRRCKMLEVDGAAGLRHHLVMRVHAARSFFVLVAAAAGVVGCATSNPTKPAAGHAAVAPPPNAVMLDYMSPEEMARSKAAEARAAPPPLPGTIGAPDPAPRIRQTIVIGRDNHDPVWETDHAPEQAYDEAAAQNRGGAPDRPTTYRSGPVYYYRGGVGGAGQGTGPGTGPGTPHVGGDWPSAPSYGPKQMR